MRFLAILAVLIFAFASVSVSAVSSALASSSAALVATSVLDALACQTEHPTMAKSPIFKPCEKRINGQAVVCHFDLGLPLDCLAYGFKRPALARAVFRGASPELSLTLAHFRPPQLS